MSIINKPVFYVPTAIISGAGVAAAGYYTYKYFQNRDLHWKTDSSSSESYYTAHEVESDDEFLDVPEEPTADITEEDLLYERVDKLMEGDEESIEDAYSCMKEYFGEMSENANFLWRYAKVHHLKGKFEEQRTRELNEKGLEYAKKAVDLDPKNPEAHKWFAVLTGMQAEFITDKIKQTETAKIFFRHIQEALLWRRRDWELHHLLGVFEYKLASLSAFEKLFARKVFKGISTCDYQVAEAYFRNAELYNPKPSKDTKLFLAKCSYGEKDFKKAFRYLVEALEMKVTSIQDKISHKEAERLRYEYTKKL